MAAAANSGGENSENDRIAAMGGSIGVQGEPGTGDESIVADAIESGKATAGEVREAHQRATEMAKLGYDRDDIEAELNQRLNLQNAIITVVVGGATAYAGLNVMSSIGSSMNLSEGDMFYNSSQSLEQGIGSFFTNLPTVFVVIALVLIIGYLTLLRGR